MNKSYSNIYTVVRQIPAGCVTTYGQIARLAGLPGHARQVGYALNALAENQSVPWHRVINVQGRISQRANPVYEDIQRELLRQEGIEFGANGRISLQRYQWKISSDCE